MKRRWLLPAIMLVGLLSPLTASADAGTPLMWAGMLHLTIGNAIIGIGEGLGIAWVFRQPKRRCVPVMIGANYFSAWAGGVGIAQAISDKLDWSLYTAWSHFWLLVLITYLLTLLLEWPLVAVCFWWQAGWARRSIKASLLVQTVSYVLLFGWYWGASGKSLYTRMNVIPLAEMKLPTDALLYFIGSPDGRVYEMDLGSQIKRVVGEAASTNHGDRLLFQALATNSFQAELCLRRDADRDEDAVFEIVTQPFSTTNVFVEPQDHLRQDLWFNYGSAAVLREATNSGWEFFSGFWALEGMEAYYQASRAGLYFAWETPFSQWTVRSATHLPGDVVIFQFGENQICILDAPSRRIARIVEGRGPAVALKNVDLSSH